jgi:hypothetical protein
MYYASTPEMTNSIKMFDPNQNQDGVLREEEQKQVRLPFHPLSGS